MSVEHDILRTYRTILVVGASSIEAKPSYWVSEYMQAQGYRIIPVNPDETEVLGERCYPDLRSVPEPVEFVNVFRRPHHIPPHVDDILAARPRVVWLQLGIRNDEAAETLARAGIEVVQDRCLLVEHRRLR